MPQIFVPIEAGGLWNNYQDFLPPIRCLLGDIFRPPIPTTQFKGEDWLNQNMVSDVLYSFFAMYHLIFFSDLTMSTPMLSLYHEYIIHKYVLAIYYSPVVVLDL